MAEDGELRELRAVKASEILWKIQNSESVVYDRIQVKDDLDINNFDRYVKDKRPHYIVSNIKITNSQFNGGMIFVGHTFGGDIDFSGTCFSKDVTFFLCRFMKHADFNKVHFQRLVQFKDTQFEEFTWFNNAYFKDDFILEGSTFKNGASFKKAQINGNALFGRIIFEEEAIFSGVLFMKYAYFRNSQHKGDSYFNDAEFYGNVLFERSVFEKGCYFNHSQFGQEMRFSYLDPIEINFSQVHFNKITDFRDSVFNGYLIFSEAIFDDNANFCNSKFKSAKFIRSEFLKKSEFNNATFSAANFYKSLFEGDALFDQVKFEDSIFSESHFHQIADFRESEFKKSDFVRSRFDDEAIFEKVNFKESALFDDARFFGDCKFTGTNFKNIETNFGVANFRRSKFIGDAKFDACNFTKVNFGNSQFINAYFTGSHFIDEADFALSEFFGNVDFSKTYFTKGVEFNEVRFNKEAKFNAIKIYDHLNLENSKSSSIKIDANFKDPWDLKMAFSNFDKLDIPWDLVKDRIHCRCDTYRKLVTNYNRLERFGDADSCYLMYKKALKEEYINLLSSSIYKIIKNLENQDPFSKKIYIFIKEMRNAYCATINLINYWLSFLFYGHGVKLGVPLIVVVGTVMFFAYVYTHGGQASSSYPRGFIISAKAFIGIAQLQNETLSGPYEYYSIIERFLGSLLMITLTLVLGKKMLR